MLGCVLMLQLCHMGGSQTPLVGRTSRCVPMMIFCLDVCLYKQVSAPLKLDWLEVAKRGGIETCLKIILVCRSFWTSPWRWCFSVYGVLLFFLLFISSAFFPLWWRARAQWLPSAPIWDTAPVNPPHSSPWHIDRVLLCARLCMSTSEETVCVPKLLQSQSSKDKTRLARRKGECIQLFLLQTVGTRSVLS